LTIVKFVYCDSGDDG